MMVLTAALAQPASPELPAHRAQLDLLVSRELRVQLALPGTRATLVSRERRVPPERQG